MHFYSSRYVEVAGPKCKPDRTDSANVRTLDLLTFSLIMFLATKPKAAGRRIPIMLGTIAEDATRYFLVIFSSHLVLTLTLTLGRVGVVVALSGL